MVSYAAMTTARRLAAVAVAPALVLAAATVAFALPPYTTAPKTSAGGTAQAELYRVTASCRSTFDRLVFRARSGTPGYDVRYVRRIVADGSGLPVPLAGTQRIRIVLRPARGHTNAGANLIPRVITTNCPNLRQVKSAGDFEGVVTYGLGLRRRTGFRVFRLTSPTRVVIDVRH